jgi:hypothetical protein
MSTVIDTKNLTKRYRESRGHALNLTIEEGEVFSAFLAPTAPAKRQLS